MPEASALPDSLRVAGFGMTMEFPVLIGSVHMQRSRMHEMPMSQQDHQEANELLLDLAAQTSIFGQGQMPVGNFEEAFRAVIQSKNPNASVIAMAGSMQARKFDPSKWPQIVISALDDQFRVELNRELISNQRELADSNDRLGRKMLFVAWVGVAVAVVGALAALLPLFGK